MSDDSDFSPEELAVERFAQALMAVRDGAIRQCDWTLNVGGSTAMHTRWRHWAERDEIRGILTESIPDTVDQTIGVLLNAIDNGEIELGWRTDAGWVLLRDLGEGILTDMYGGSPGWRALSTERVLPW
jgi:hypothetical protein